MTTWQTLPQELRDHIYVLCLTSQCDSLPFPTLNSRSLEDMASAPAKSHKGVMYCPRWSWVTWLGVSRSTNQEVTRTIIRLYNWQVYQGVSADTTARLEPLGEYSKRQDFCQRYQQSINIERITVLTPGSDIFAMASSSEFRTTILLPEGGLAEAEEPAQSPDTIETETDVRGGGGINQISRGRAFPESFWQDLQNFLVQSNALHRVGLERMDLLKHVKKILNGWGDEHGRLRQAIELQVMKNYVQITSDGGSFVVMYKVRDRDPDEWIVCD